MCSAALTVGVVMLAPLLDQCFLSHIIFPEKYIDSIVQILLLWRSECNTRHTASQFRIFSVWWMILNTLLRGLECTFLCETCAPSKNPSCTLYACHQDVFEHFFKDSSSDGQWSTTSNAQVRKFSAVQTPRRLERERCKDQDTLKQIFAGW